MKVTIVLALLAVSAYSAHGDCTQQCTTVCGLTTGECRLVAGLFGALCDAQQMQCTTACTAICTCVDNCQTECAGAGAACQNGGAGDVLTAVDCQLQSLTCIPDCEAQCVVQNAVGGLAAGLQNLGGAIGGAK